MRTIMVLNSKGGCGKSTLATNIAAYFASRWEGRFALADFDPQGSSLDWLARRPAHVPPLLGINAAKDGLRHLPRNVDLVVIDPPARLHGTELREMVKYAETIVVPVLPSPIDIQACGKFVRELYELHRVENKEVKVAVVANRVRENLLVWNELERFLDGLRIPFIAKFRDAQNYIRAYSRGLGIHELPPYLAAPDWEQWEPLVRWLESKRSRP